MARVRGKNTKPELVVRKLAHRLGYRYRLHVRGLPGSPDLVFPGRGKIIFVHGCFWHSHHKCRLATVPKTRRAFWLEKMRTNRERDARILRQLKAAGWQCRVIWECETRDLTLLHKILRRHLD
jgi:DNA mismatch endonuclease (patch repair protein)